MTDHELSPEPGLVADAYAAAAPVLELDPGDRLTVRTLDAGGFLQPWQDFDERPPTMFATPRGHCLAGPIGVRGARAGQFVAVTLHALRPAAHGYTVAAVHDNWLNRRLDVVDRPGFLHWDILAGTATSSVGLSVPTAPFLGVIGTLPAEPGEHSTIPPRPRNGGNIDCRELVAGSTLYLPVEVDGAQLFVGDGHAAQGDGEVGGTAIECGMTTELTVSIVDAPPVDAVHATTPAGRITFGFSADLNEAAASALDAMLDWLRVLCGLDRSAALAFAGVAVDLRVTQIANGTWGVHAVLPWSIVP